MKLSGIVKKFLLEYDYIWKWANSLTDEEKKSVKMYASNVGYDLNYSLRKGNIHKLDRNTIKHLDSAIRKGFSLTGRCYRAIDLNYFESMSIEDKYIEKGYLSVTKDFSVAKKFVTYIGRDGIVAHFKIKKVNAIYPSFFPSPENEDEYLLARNVTVKLIRKEVENEKIKHLLFEVSK